jgi:hypothetical protein
VKFHKLIILILLTLPMTSWAGGNQGREMASFLSSNDSVNCMWVDKVGDTVPSKKVNFKDMATTCLQGEGNEQFNGSCEGTMRCTGIQGWGDIYLENLSCPGRIAGGQAVCGRTQKVSNFPVGIKSCIHYFVDNPPIESKNGNNVIRSGSSSFETAPEVNQ